MRQPFKPRMIQPEKIEEESFRIIDAELPSHFRFTPEEHAVTRRVIHATGDFEFARLLRFHPRAFTAAFEAFTRIANVVADVQMVQAGISKVNLTKFGGKVLCFMDDPDVWASAKAAGHTRAIETMRRARALGDGLIIVIGNAPTALLETLRLIDEDGWRPALVIGVPVGFVSAAESKDALHATDETGVPYITCLGRKGGTPVAVSITNALLSLALGRRETAQAAQGS